MLSRETSASAPPSALPCARAEHSVCSDTTADMLSSLKHVESRIKSAWTRIGLADGDRQRKWTGFVEGRLRPFLHDYLRLQESEEMSLAAANDRLFSELFFLSRRLNELPRTKELAQLVEVIGATGVGFSGTADGSAEEDSARSGDVDGPVLPSFVAVASAMTQSGDDEKLYSGADGLVLSRVREEMEPKESLSAHSSAPEGRRRSPTPQGFQNGHHSHAAMAAVWQIAQSMTHQELQRNLDVEVARMSALADARLRQLCMLYKQRALLRLPPQEQATLRKKYAERILGRGTGTTVTSTTVASTAGANETKSRQRHPLSSSAPISTRQSAATAGLSSSRATHATASDDDDLLSESLPKQLQNTENDISWTVIPPNEEEGEVELEEAEGRVREVESHRGTVFSVDLSDLTRFGRRQDLSLARIGTEAQEIYAEINTQNDLMVAQAEKELKYVEELWDLFKAPIHEKKLNKGAETCTEEEGEDKDNAALTEGEEQKTDATTANEEEDCNETETAIDLQDIFVEEEEDGVVEEDEDADELSQADFRQRLAQLQAEYEPNHSSQQQQAHFTASESHGPALLEESILSRPTDVTSLPSPLMRIFTARSFAPVLVYITNFREDLQRRLLHRHVRIAQSLTQRLTSLYREYYEKTHDAAYRKSPDYSLWLHENAAAAAATTPSITTTTNNTTTTTTQIKRGMSHDMFVVDPTKRDEDLWAHVLSAYTPRGGDDSLRDRIAEVCHVISRAKDEARSLLRRLRLLATVEPLLQRRAEIIAQQRAIQDGSRERLLSKKVNMAKQLLFEENARRQFARELPRLHEQLETVLCKWDRAVGTDATRRLIVRGADVAAVVREFREETAEAPRTRPRVARPLRSRTPPPQRPMPAAPFATPQPTRRRAMPAAKEWRGAGSPPPTKRTRITGPQTRAQSQTGTPFRTGKRE